MTYSCHDPGLRSQEHGTSLPLSSAPKVRCGLTALPQMTRNLSRAAVGRVLGPRRGRQEPTRRHFNRLERPGAERVNWEPGHGIGVLVLCESDAKHGGRPGGMGKLCKHGGRPGAYGKVMQTLWLARRVWESYANMVAGQEGMGKLCKHCGQLGRCGKVMQIWWPARRIEN